MFQLVEEGHGGKRIAHELNQQNIIEGKRWVLSTVLAILNNLVYLGKRVWNKKSDAGGEQNDVSQWIVAENAHPAIVDQQLWDATQASLSARKINKPQ